MEIVPSTFIALVVSSLLLWLGPRKGLWLFMAVTPLGAAAAFNLPAVGGASILVLDLAAMVLFGVACLTPDGPARIAATMRPFRPGFFILLLAIFGVFATMFFPRVFQGMTEVFGIARADNALGIVSVPLRPTSGNITQLFRLMLSAIVFLALATVIRRRPEPGPVIVAMAVATGVHFALGWADVLSNMLGLEVLLDPIRTANYSILADHRLVGIKRMIGGFPEASSFGYYTLALFGFWLVFYATAPGNRLGAVCLAATAILLLRSTSSAAYVASVLFLVTAGLLTIAFRLRRTVSQRMAMVWIGGATLLMMFSLAVVGAYQLLEPVTQYLDRLIFTKLSTSSGIERGSWNTQAFQNFLDTWGLGVGLGSMRASNWFLACLASIGAIGTLLFLGFLWQLGRATVETENPWRDATILGLKAGCLAQLCAALLTHPTPDLGIMFFAMAGIAVGLAEGGRQESLREIHHVAKNIDVYSSTNARSNP